MTDAHEVIDIPVPDYSAYLHTQTVMVRADQLVPGDEILIPEATRGPLPVLRGQVYRVTLSQAAAAHDGPGWTLLTFGAAMARFRTEPHEEFHRVVEPHDPPTCAYCLARFAQAQAQVARIEANKAEMMERARVAVDLLRDVGFASWHRGGPTMEDQIADQQEELAPYLQAIEAQGAPYSQTEIDLMRESGAG
jgi:hypothetical protein